ncbi:MAG: FliA/WhiG family RNA polymerase sigma factor [Clostridia bacterium]|nr:FliA/WhiG family RNA polymerase sigma factor [Clostridia bacterium]
MTDTGLTPAQIDALDTNDLLALYKETGDEALKWPLVMRYEGLIKSAALQIRGIYASFAQVEDIVSEGILTLVAAIDKFDPDKGIKFETYISKRIRGMVIDLARKQDWLPRSLRQKSKRIDMAVGELATELGRFPSDEEIADRLGVPLEKYLKDAASVSLGNILSLDALMDTRESEVYTAEPADDSPEASPEGAFLEQELHRALVEGIEGLRENEQLVLSLYYEKNLHMKEIAQVLKLSEPRISQIHTRAIQKLRLHMEQYKNGTPAPPPTRGRKARR